MKNPLKIIIFLIPFYFMLYINYYVDSYACCRITYDGIASKMALGYDLLIKAEYNERNLCLSLIKKQKEKPELAVVGSSRSGLFDAGCFDGIDKCINLFMSGANLEDYKGVIGTLEYYNKMPKHVILEINGSLFNKYEDSRYLDLEDAIHYYTALVNKEKASYHEKCLGFDMIKFFSPSYFLYNLKQLMEGKRFEVIFDKNVPMEKHFDGSFTPPNENIDDMEFVMNTTNEIIEKGVIYGLGKIDITDEKKKDFEQMVDFLQERGVNVMLYIPPYSKPIYEYMRSEEKYNPVLATEDYILDYASKKGIQVYGSFNPDYCGLQMEDLYDAYHIRKKAIMKTYYLREEIKYGN